MTRCWLNLALHVISRIHSAATPPLSLTRSPLASLSPSAGLLVWLHGL